MSYLTQLSFQAPWVLSALLLLPLWIWWDSRRSTRPELAYAPLSGLQGLQTWRSRYRHSPSWLRYAAYALLIVALARPQSLLQKQDIEAEGIDIMLVMDISGSMLAQDFEPDRIQAAKKVAQEFVDMRPNDRIGLVVFAGESFTQCPLTTDHGILKQFIGNLECGLLVDRTAIGLGLANAVRRLSESQAKSRVVILMTDGENNAGYVSPAQATDAAKKLGIRVYTLGIGTIGRARGPVAQNPNGGYVFGWREVVIDEELLRFIASETGGQYFRATDNTSLKQIYVEIDRLERSKIQTTAFRRYREEFHFFLLAALFCLCLEFMLRHLVFRSPVEY